ncbi:glycosyltransferase family 87 protein [Chitinophaga nivalis]|uniref:DUF2029 domain-containing protein n=1 Tax=Chitinophaga nivalis TaxID=2991709 RepID=A0ABT3IEX4_9BACT|nr:glycosyltransferase family 87 protein [Chitinophaga nivalis]MCW3467799.1 DUF2029 domain-containing protein [Chitinophaga nivalis]MCW3482509.1 DUF2029 domain-containing protein [Chitinophaga nivalis]
MNFLFAEFRVFKKWKIALPVLLWFALAIIAGLAEYLHQSFNNYLIFRQVFWHTLEQTNLYAAYPSEYADINHYGPLFSMVIAPFAVLPDWLGVILWNIANAAVLLIAIRMLPLTRKNFLIVLLISAVEMMTASHNVQFNSMTAAFIIFAFVFVEKEKDIWATLFIVLGFLTKLYGIAAIVFFLFSKHRIKFTGYFIMWLVVLFCLPMIISSPAFIIQSYADWYTAISEKVVQNISSLSHTNMQDICVMGIVRRTFHTSNFNDLYVLLPAVAIFGLPLLRMAQYKNLLYRMRYLALVLISVVIFSDSAESATYVIAMVGAALWFVMKEPKSPAVIALLVFTIFVTSLATTDLCPQYIKVHVIRAFALKALPCFIIWLLLIREVAFGKFHDNKICV